MAGAMNATGKMRVGYFTQYQVEELDRRHAARAYDAADEGRDAGRCGRSWGGSAFPAPKRDDAEGGKLSGGERARLALALITRDAPHMLILDEPTNHLDVDAREALVQALNSLFRCGGDRQP
jgi:ATP-binding cassette subfamily F protein 3